MGGDPDGEPDSDADGLSLVIPAAFATAVKRDEPLPLEPHTFEALRGEVVVVRAHGFLYRGVLVGADEAELYLRGELRWVVLPLAHVTDVRRDQPNHVPLGLPAGTSLEAAAAGEVGGAGEDGESGGGKGGGEDHDR